MKEELEYKSKVMASLGQLIENREEKVTSIGKMSLAARIGLTSLKKSLRA